MIRRRLYALAAVALVAAATSLAVILAIDRFPHGLTVLACLALASAAAWYAVTRRGAVRWVGATTSVLLLIAAITAVIAEGQLVSDLLIVAGVALGLAAAAAAFRVHVQLPSAERPTHPVLFYNPKSGGGKAERLHLADEASIRGFEPVELKRGDDLEQLVHAAVERGADALAMAGGDGSQAIVAKVASQLDLPYACIPAGTRNHFALDLGVDRDDVVGALDAFVDGGERHVDLAEVNGRVFVNNVSLGLYAEAVQRPEYRDAKLRTMLAAAPDALRPDAGTLDLRCVGHDGAEEGAAILISNNSYRLGRPLGSGTRPRLDAGMLRGAVLKPATAAARRPPTRALPPRAEPPLATAAVRPVPAGIDGEATTLEPPLSFRTLPGSLRVRIAHDHPGASPSALEPDTPCGTLAALLRFPFSAKWTHAAG